MVVPYAWYWSGFLHSFSETRNIQHTGHPLHQQPGHMLGITIKLHSRTAIPQSKWVENALSS